MHFTHAFKPLSYASCDDERLALASASIRPKMESRQAPRSVRVQVEEEEKRRKELAEEMREEKAAAQRAVEGKPAAVALPTQDGGFELKEDGKLEKEQEQESRSRKLSNGQVRELKKEAFVDLLRQPSTPPPLDHLLASPPFATSAPSAVRTESPSLAESIAAVPPATDYSASPSTAAAIPSSPLPPLEIQCRVRTRIPTPHGHIFLHLYTNNHDDKEHLAFVADHAQMASTSLTTNAVEGTPVVAETNGHRLLPFIRSRSLDAKWHDGETDEERIVRGAYVGRLSADSHVASSVHPHSLDPQSPSSSCAHPHAHLHTTSAPSASSSSDGPTDPPLVRIHSECLTGEIIGSQRCDCGEQLDEAFRLITLAGRGVVVYLRQEGRGIGLLEKMRAYNLQDLGHDTVTANLMLGHGADMRTYGVAGEILRDLGVAERGVRLLTNNPDKIRQIEKEGVRVRERVAMVPRSWMAVEEALARRERRRERKQKKREAERRGRKDPLASVESSVASLAPSSLSASSSAFPSTSTTSPPSPSPSSSAPLSPSLAHSDSDSDSDDDAASLAYHLRRAGVGMIGASTTASPELEKYLRTKIERMGHMLTAPAPTPTGVMERSPLSRRETAE
jgi:GTP cyclohydrolase II